MEQVKLLQEIATLLSNDKFTEIFHSASEEDKQALSVSIRLKIHKMRENLLLLRRLDNKKANRQQEIIYANRLKLILLVDQDIDEPFPGANRQLRESKCGNTV